EADTYTVDKQSLAITAELAPKREQLVLDAENGGGLKHVALRENLRTASTLTDDEVRQVARLGLAAEKFFRRPQDVEFCFDAAGTLFLLQSRPVTNVAEYGPAAGNRLVWDNSNIIESYSGVTSPMTFSFIRQAYTIVYHCFCDVMGIPPRVVRESRPVFENMLGLFRGRVYYNLQNWYRLIRLFPGFAYNAKFMETMMGLKEPLVLDDPLPPVGFWRKWFVELPALVKLIARSVWNFARIRGTVDRFQNHFRRHYEKWDRLNMDALPPHELAALYREMEKALLWNWKAPIINDFYVMIYFGVLKKLCASWCGDTTGALQNDLICGEGGVESAEPARMLLRLAQMAQGEPALRDRILHDRLEDLPATIAADPRSAAFQAQFEKYLDLYGFRCMNELKLEEYSLRDRPHHVYQVLRNYLALNDPAALDVAAMKVREQNVRRGAEERAFSGLAKRRTWYPRGLIFRRVLRNARLGVKNRENMRFARTRIYGLLRQLLRAMGRQFAAEGILADAEDIFYLTLDEVFDYIKGTAVTTHLRELAALRRAEFDEYRRDDLPAPDERFETFGPAYHKNLFRDPRPAPKNTDGKLRGIGCSPGVVEGVVKVLKSPAEAQLSREILVAERTDPGWVPLYPAVSGILIERGSLLSHSAVVAREMGIPTIVGITGLLATVQSGQRVRMDGQAGTVDVL
ncbi:MAG: phosphoenolpyruvate synthase, partial [Planctomycetia bacterium]|nr:phosphoenolpyruvate synthase [Planctomycetia bacterium]